MWVNHCTLEIVFPDGATVELDVPPMTFMMEPVTVTTRSEPWSDANPITHQVGTHFTVRAQLNDALVRQLVFAVQEHARDAFAEWATSVMDDIDLPQERTDDDA